MVHNTGVGFSLRTHVIGNKKNKIIMKIDFTKFKLYVGLDKKDIVICDIKNEISNLIYNNIAWITAHRLSEKIYDSDGEIELSENEIEVIHKSETMFTGAFIDSFNNNLK